MCVKASSLQMMATLADSLNGTVLDLQTADICFFFIIIGVDQLMYYHVNSQDTDTQIHHDTHDKRVDHFEEVLQVVED